MAKVTSKLQVTVPKILAAHYGIEPGSEIEWQAAGDAIRVLPGASQGRAPGLAERLASFDAATARQRRRQRRASVAANTAARSEKGGAGERGWTREDLYDRAAPR